MKDFLKTTLAVVLGVLIASLITVFIFAGFAGSGSMQGNRQVPSQGVLKIDLSKISLTEQAAPENPLASLKSEEPLESVGILQAINAINAAAEDPGVKFIYFKTDDASIGIGTAQELRKALENFRRTSGKAIVSYIERPTSLSYYLSSVSDKIYMTSCIGSGNMMVGANVQSIYIKDLLDKLGINMQLIRHGKYKSAGEMYIRNSASPENREQNQRMVDSIWETMSSAICESRGITTDRLNAMIDNLELALPEDFLRHSLVDGLVSGHEMEEKLSALSVVDSFDEVSMIPFAAYAASKQPANLKAKNKIAVIFASGEIVDGNVKQEVAGDRFAKIIAKVRADSTVKAVVLRVNSPGGSVIASEKIKDELDLMKGVKPLVASFGDYAASGGYWISNNCDKIFTDATTITGSIGVFGLVPDFSRLAKDKLHVNFESTGTNRHGDMYTLTRPLTEDELGFWTRQIECIYDKFTSIVASGRGMEQTAVDEIGQGRVWTGADAIKLGLADETGTLQDAIAWAELAAGDSVQGKWSIVEYPAPMTAMEMIMDMVAPVEDSDHSIILDRLRECKSPKIIARMPCEYIFN